MDLHAEDGPVTLRTERLVLRPPEMADADWIAAGVSLPEVQRFLTTPPHPYRHEDAIEFLSGCGQQSGVFVIVEGERPLGIIALEPGDDGDEFGYWMHPDGWGRGLMTEAGRALLGHAFETGHETVLSGHYTDNPRSARVLTKLGFREAGMARHFCKFRGEEVPVQRLSLHRDEWL
ncbi:GNAT family N-acetyltransferase [Pelagovum pacificum]|uniref:GNAT family N-acetyltransferase n=1 Tax=Pelagovum pacificum TaxID=2588711 RepID=A0A5C5GEI4_9RHOB|nr:GNAT family N-acetyltransferase [Pelagovum pacificum]QQA44517.1 GNAT family N-acetyltransferase [Pelagovum pacificum]TNY32369.1 GNAT family N-acetyltransferase [Pelagovum pacificum]